MKIFGIAYFLLLLPCAVGAQRLQTVQEPEYGNSFYYIDPTSDSLKPLEKQSPNMSFKTKLMGYGGGKTIYEVKGGKSPVRFKYGSDLQFIVRGIPSGIDPTDLILLVRFDSKKDKREFPYVNVGALGRKTTTVNPNEKAIAFTATKYGDYSLKIAPTALLEPGEYAISANSLGHLFCFGVDRHEK